MAYEHKPNTGSLFKNDRKESDTHPDYKGSALIEGREYWLDAWVNTAKDGSKYIKLKAKEAREPGALKGKIAVGQDFDDDLSDEIPF